MRFLGVLPHTHPKRSLKDKTKLSLPSVGNRGLKHGRRDISDEGGVLGQMEVEKIRH